MVPYTAGKLPDTQPKILSMQDWYHPGCPVCSTFYCLLFLACFFFSALPFSLSEACLRHCSCGSLSPIILVAVLDSTGGIDHNSLSYWETLRLVPLGGSYSVALSFLAHVKPDILRQEFLQDLRLGVQLLCHGIGWYY